MEYMPNSLKRELERRQKSKSSFPEQELMKLMY